MTGTSRSDRTGNQGSDADRRYHLDGPKAVGAPANSRWGYLPCGCSHNGHGGHVR